LQLLAEHQRQGQTGREADRNHQFEHKPALDAADREADEQKDDQIVEEMQTSSHAKKIAKRLFVRNLRTKKIARTDGCTGETEKRTAA